MAFISFAQKCTLFYSAEGERTVFWLLKAKACLKYAVAVLVFILALPKMKHFRSKRENLKIMKSLSFISLKMYGTVLTIFSYSTYFQTDPFVKQNPPLRSLTALAYLFAEMHSDQSAGFILLLPHILAATLQITVKCVLQFL